MMMMSFARWGSSASCGSSTASRGLRRRRRRRPARRPDRVLRPQGPDGATPISDGRRPGHPAHGLRRLPDDVRDHHRRPDHRRHRRPGQVRRLDGLRRRLGHDRLLPGRALGLRSRGHVGGWIANKLRRSTSPVAPRCTSTPVPRHSPWPWCSASASAGREDDAAAQRAVRRCSAPACCGSAGSASTPAPSWPPTAPPPCVCVNTQVATAAALLGWLLVERIRDGKPTSVGASSGAVAGLVAITPACRSSSPLGAIIVGLVAGVVCALAVGLKYKLGYDDSLDVVGVHFVGGWSAPCRSASSPPRDGHRRASTACSTAAASTSSGGRRRRARRPGLLVRRSRCIIGFVIQKTIGFRVTEEDEVTGIDNAEHAESAYDFASLGSSGATAPLAGQARAEARNTREELGMKLVTAVIKPYQLDAVKEALAHRRRRADRQRGPGLRPAEGPHRGLPRCRVHGGVRAEDPDRGRRQRARRGEGRRRRRRGRLDRQDR